MIFQLIRCDEINLQLQTDTYDTFAERGDICWQRICIPPISISLSDCDVCCATDHVSASVTVISLMLSQSLQWSHAYSGIISACQHDIKWHSVQTHSWHDACDDGFACCMCTL